MAKVKDRRDLTGEVALVTGAWRGMGKAVALRLAAAGADVAVNDINAKGAASTAAEVEKLGRCALAVPGDVTKASDVEAMVLATVTALGKLSILINNAGVLRPTRLLEITEDEWDFVMDVTVKGAFLVTRAALPHMIKNGWGKIVNFSSSAGKTVSTLGGAHYTTAKTALLGFNRAVAKEMAPFGVTSNAICPGLIDTEMVRQNCSPEQLKKYQDSFPISRLGLPDEVADLVLFLSSHESDYITGAAIDINGGDLMV
jgi:NAD(P)-dependent dehydrogenase (short-subunit alcohol dehydrogenase family)